MAVNLTTWPHWLHSPANSQLIKTGLDNDDLISWNGVSRLIFLSALAAIGSMGSIFIISAVTLLESLQVRGSIYLVNLALANLLTTALVVPASCIAILASIPNDRGICNFKWLTTVICFLVSVFSFMFMSVENFLGLGDRVNYEQCCTKNRIVLVVTTIWVISIGFAVSQQATGFGPSFCNPSAPVWVPYHVMAGVMFVIIPTLVTMGYFFMSVFKLKSFKTQMEILEDPRAYVLTDEYLLKSNIVVFVLMLVMWIPGITVATISTFRPVSQQLLDNSWWAALSNSCIYSYLYAATNRNFREVFNKLFYYCCCKSHVTFSRRQQVSRQGEGTGIGLRLHIIPGLNIYAHRKETYKDSNRNNQTKSGKVVSDL
ncbi:mu-type opioid receptor-like [Limulus polyphemus]|uniref:Mu-type opioid receptor-like n=1 Tax=Limulus polyphemus TaxID=6850 RepID=A0ABM1BYJ8_LIMPO|nr:mu-type opioid receptor-like [Limulus polyphemus]XP_022235938.1 mu-type opioid receptor-like [Limulus polyphemus]XP_022235943.1 mu-type opioid receptor-like [Limulus polyphemus]